VPVESFIPAAILSSPKEEREVWTTMTMTAREEERKVTTTMMTTMVTVGKAASETVTARTEKSYPCLCNIARSTSIGLISLMSSIL